MMITKNDLNIVNRLNKELLQIESKLDRKQINAQERQELEQLKNKTTAARNAAELWIDELSDMVKNGVTGVIFAQVFIRGMTQREVAAAWGINETYVSYLIRKGIQEINEKAPGISAP